MECQLQTGELMILPVSIYYETYVPFCLLDLCGFAVTWLPKHWFENSFIPKANVSLVGRNLFLLYNATKGIDPESGINNQNVGTAIEMNSMPGSRSFGFNLNLSF